MTPLSYCIPFLGIKLRSISPCRSLKTHSIDSQYIYTYEWKIALKCSKTPKKITLTKQSDSLKIAHHMESELYKGILHKMSS